MSFIPSIDRHAAAADASHDISSSSSDNENSDSSESIDEPRAAIAQETAKIESEVNNIKKSFKQSRPIYEDYLMPESERASSESGSEPDRLSKKARRRSPSEESESEIDRFKREIREEVQRELRAALNAKAEKREQKKPEKSEATIGASGGNSSAGRTSKPSGNKGKKTLSEKAISYKVTKPATAVKTSSGGGGGGLSYKYQKQLATCVRQLGQLGDKINAIAQSADKRS